MAKTKNDLAAEVADMLSIKDPDESLDASDASYIRGKYDRCLEFWRDEGLVYWTNTNNTTEEIPEIVFDAVAMMLSGEVASTFSKPQPTAIDERMGVLPAGVVGKKRLRKILNNRTENEPTKFESF